AAVRVRRRVRGGVVSDSNATIIRIDAGARVSTLGCALRIITCDLEVAMDDGRRVRIEGQPYVMELSLAQRVRVNIDLEVAS
ncbi:MAG TPA: hypothetical protein VIK83_05275, partial [Coriobacteriia bacterium]